VSRAADARGSAIVQQRGARPRSLASGGDIRNFRRRTSRVPREHRGRDHLRPEPDREWWGEAAGEKEEVVAGLRGFARMAYRDQPTLSTSS